MRALVLYEEYSREEVHNIFDAKSKFTPQAGTWGLHGIVKIPERPRDYVFFVTFGRQQSNHLFDEGITAEGVLRWQSQPKQSLADVDIKRLIDHDEIAHAVYLFLRTAAKRLGTPADYTYLGRLKYLLHDRDRERPVYFTWQILDWPIPHEVRERMALRFEGGAISSADPLLIGDQLSRFELIYTPTPVRSSQRGGVHTSSYAYKVQPDYAERDARNRKLGFAGEVAVLEYERRRLIAAGRSDLAELVVHVSLIEGDGAGYDIKSYTELGEQKFIEVKTTRTGELTAFYLSLNEVRFAAEHPDRYYLYRIYNFDEELHCELSAGMRKPQ